VCGYLGMDLLAGRIMTIDTRTRHLLVERRPPG
jgi:hypothetical protein